MLNRGTDQQHVIKKIQLPLKHNLSGHLKGAVAKYVISTGVCNHHSWLIGRVSARGEWNSPKDGGLVFGRVYLEGPLLKSDQQR